MSSRYSLELQIWSSLALGAFLIAYLSSGRNVFRFTIVFAVSFLFLALLFFGSVRLLRVWRESDKSYQEAKKELAAARALSQKEAQERAIALLLDGNLYRVIENPIPKDSLHSLGPELQKFFTRFEKAQQIRGDLVLNRTGIGESSLRKGFLKIGTDIDFTEIVARPDEDTVYMIDGSETEDELNGEGFPTIFHYIVASTPTAAG
ncbi:MAG TPA: hypothetical protein VE263_11245 [Candidatus Angelobacter sp.]|nr:hypothetical protein [Candidatus Angelobacter sp.]